LFDIKIAVYIYILTTYINHTRDQNTNLLIHLQRKKFAAFIFYSQM